MKTEEVRATEIALTPYTTLILLSLPASGSAQTTILDSSIDDSPALAGASHKEEWKLPPLARQQERSSLHT
jgi:hypothetical protein